MSHLDKGLRCCHEQSHAGRRLNRQGAYRLPHHQENSPQKNGGWRDRGSRASRLAEKMVRQPQEHLGCEGTRGPVTGLGAPSIRSPLVTAAKRDKERTQKRQQTEGS